MITRHHHSDSAISTAEYSDCERYRYALTRTWDAKLPKLGFIMLNPSKATEVQNDPTVERCERRARALGFGAFRVTNIFAWRETDPHKMRRAKDPVGPDNDACLTELMHWSDTVIAAWGVHGEHLNRGPAVEAVLRRTGQHLHCLGLTKHGHPRHPLYVSYAQRPEIWINSGVNQPDGI